MRVSTDLSLRQTLSITTDMRLAIDMLAMSNEEILEQLLKEQAENAALEEFSYQPSNILSDAAFDVALKTKATFEDFRTQLWQQAQLMKLGHFELKIAYFLINSLNDRGLLPDHQEVYQLITDELGVFKEWIDLVRLRLMALEPQGCGAFDIKEYLLFKLKNCTFAHEELKALLLAAKNKFIPADIMRIKSDPQLDELKGFCTSPVNDFAVATISIDILVEKNGQNLRVCLLNRPSNRFFVRPKAESLKDQHRRAHFLLKALRFREDNLLKVSSAIVMHQQQWFLEKGPLKPLSLKDVAEEVGLHESSISRLSRQKYLSCAQGTFELNHFFNQKALINDQGDECSPFAIKDQIRLLINRENKERPLSDQQIHKALLLADMPIARRTVTKYRESLKLPSAKERRVYF